MAYAKKRPPLDYCPVEAVCALIGARWKARLLDLLLKDEARLDELRAMLPGPSRQALIQQLEAMEVDGLIAVRWEIRGRARRRVYALTEFGRELHAGLEPLVQWAEARLRPSAHRDCAAPGEPAKSVPR